MKVLTTAWMGAGAPLPAAARVGVGVCARCAFRGDVVPALAAVSTSFTGFDGWVEPGGRGLCAACAWAYSWPQLRAAAHLVTRLPVSLRRLERAALHALLGAGSLRPDLALAVPLRPGRKHVLPDATWGQVRVEDTNLPWSDADAARLETLAELRRRGFGSRMLAEPAPPFQVLRRQPREQWEPTMRAWEQLTPWRVSGGPWLPLAVHITTPVTEGRPR